MNNKKLIWSLGILITIIIFLFLIPNSIYNLSPFIFSVLGTILTLFFLFQVIYNFKNFQEYKNKINEGNSKKFKVLNISSIPLGFILFMTFFINFHFNKNKEVEDFGIKVKGEIISGEIITAKRKTGISKTYYSTVRFNTIEGQTIISKEQLSEEEYRTIYKGEEVDLSYSSKDPNIIKIFFEKKKSDDITRISDLITFLSFSERDREILLKHQYPHLKKIADNKWADNSNEIYFLNKTSLELITLSNSINEFRDELNELGFNIIKNKNTEQEFYESTNHKIILKTIDDINIRTHLIIEKK